MTATEHWGDNLVYTVFLLSPLMSGGLLIWLARRGPQPGRRNSFAKVVLINLLVLTFLTSTVLAAAETWYRFCLDTTDSFGLTRLNRRWFERHWKLNQMGYRDSVSFYPLQRAPGKRRITFLGDSFTAGHGVEDVEDRFANRIRNQASDEVHVWADLGYDTGHAIELVQGLIAKGYQFDQVVLVYNLNDIGDLSPEWKAVNDQVRSAAPPPFLIRHSFFLDTVHYRLKARFNPDMANYCQSMLQDYDGPLWQEQQRRLTTLRELVESHGGHLSVVTFPFLQHPGPHYEFRAVHAKLDAFWGQLGIPHLDLLALYEAHRSENLTVNGNDAHPNVLAHRLAAEAIEPFLRKPASTGRAPPSF